MAVSYTHLKALLDYYRQRTGIGHPDIDMQNIKISKEEQKWADDEMCIRDSDLCGKW